MAVPVLASLAMSWFVRPAFTLRYLLPSSLFFFVLFGGALGSLPSRYLRWGAVGALAALMTLHHVEASRPYRPDMRKAGQILSQQDPGKNGLLLVGIFNPDMERMYLNYPEEHLHHCAMTGESTGKTISLLDHYETVWILCEFDYGRGYPSHEAMESGLKEAGLSFKRLELSADHYTFMTNSNWPELRRRDALKPRDLALQKAHVTLNAAISERCTSRELQKCPMQMWCLVRLCGFI